MRQRANSHDQSNKIRDRTIMSLFRARKSKLQHISKDNLRIFQKISTQKSQYSSENRSKSQRQNHQKSRHKLFKNIVPISQTLANITNTNNNLTQPLSDIRTSKICLNQKSNSYILPSICKQWNSLSLFKQPSVYKQQQDSILKMKQTQKIDRAWTRLKSKYKFNGLFLIS